MYSWSDDMSDWADPSKYKFDDKTKADRDRESEKARAHGPRAYSDKAQPNMQFVDPHKHVTSNSPNPLIIAVDVTGSMQRWPFEIFDRLPLLYNTLSQYRPDLEICFAAIGDGGYDKWPLQCTEFSKGFDLEERLKALYGEGGGGDEPESYGLFAYWVQTHVHVPKASRPFLIVFGDASMHEKVPRRQLSHFLGDEIQGDASSLRIWQEVSASWDTWFLRRPTGRKGDRIDQQWAEAIGAQQVVHMQDEQRAVDYAMGLVARAWGHFGDFEDNMRARQDETKVKDLSSSIGSTKPRLFSCPGCNAALPPAARGRFKCAYCGASVQV